MPGSGATGAIARGKRVSTGCGRKRRSVPAWPWICGVKPTPKAVNKPSPYSIVHGLDKPGVFTTVSKITLFNPASDREVDHRRRQADATQPGTVPAVAGGVGHAGSPCVYLRGAAGPGGADAPSLSTTDDDPRPWGTHGHRLGGRGE